MNIPGDFGGALRMMRQTLGLSQLALASRLSSTQRHLSFLETGRSQPTAEFLQRLCSELSLSAAQRGALFEASGFRNPYPARRPDSDEIALSLDLIARRILDNWPFPGFALDPQWTVLRMNQPARVMFTNLGFDPANTAPNLLKMMLSQPFRSLVRNWEEASQALYFRLLKAAETDAEIAAEFETARREGVFNHVPAMITGQRVAPVFIPFEMGSPGGPVLRMTSFVGQLATAQDAVLEGLEVELMVPLDDSTEAILRHQSQA